MLELLKQVGGVLLLPGVVAFLWASYRALRRGQLLDFWSQTMERYKQDRVKAGDPESPLALGMLLKAGLEGRPELSGIVKRTLKRAGTNTDTVVRDALASVYRSDPDPNPKPDDG